MSFQQNIDYIASQIREAPSTTFIIGAGASQSAGVPTAHEIVELVREKYAFCIDRMPEEDRTDYGKVMRALDPSQRDQFLKPFLENAKINWGQIALASLIKAEKVSSVLTFNFDLILEKAVSLLGMQIPVYDFGFAPTDQVGRLAKPSIVHLHGQNYGLVLLNTDDETEQHRASLKRVLKDAVQNNLTVVIGYSGEADSALETIQSEFNSEKRLLWLGYDETPPKHLDGLLAQNYTEYFGGCDFDRSCIELASKLDAWPPLIVKNPMRHLLEELQPVMDYPVSQNDDHFDILSPMRGNLELKADDWDQDEDCTQETLSYLFGKKVDQDQLDALRENKHKLSKAAHSALYWVHIKRAAASVGQKDFQVASESFQTALSFNEKGYEAYYNWGVVLSDLGDPAVYDEALEKCMAAKKISGLPVYNLACVLALKGETDAALDELYACFERGTLETLQHLEEDTDLDSLRGLERFKELFKKVANSE